MSEMRDALRYFPFLVSGAARQALWTCLVDEPTLLIRFFFEKLFHKERRVSHFFLLHSIPFFLS
jgi:hypothetical protein